MTGFWAGLVTLSLLCLSVALGRAIQPHLSERHRSRETIETMQLIIGMLVTFAALVLGLLTASVKTSYDTAARGRQEYALHLTQLDRCLRDYGPAAEPIRRDLAAYTAAVIASTWPDEPHPQGVAYPDTSHMPLVGADPTLAHLMDRAGVQIRRLDAADTYHARQIDACLADYRDVIRSRLTVIEDATASLAWPFYCILVFWLMVIFAVVGLAAPPNRLALIGVVLCAVSLSSAMFVILDLGRPYRGIVRIHSTDMREALAHMMEPPAPAQ